LKIGCSLNFISVFLLTFYVVLAKTKLKHEGEISEKYPSFLLFKYPPLRIGISTKSTKNRGWICAPTHHVQLDIPMENFFTLLKHIGIEDMR